MTDLTVLYQWFNENRTGIINGHLEECVLIKDNAVIGYYPNTDAALAAAQKTGFSMGSFLIQDCITKDEDVMMYYNRAVCFG
jgi:hypothetical protein